MLEKKDSILEKAVLIGVITRDQDEVKSKEYLDELEFLTYTAGGNVIKRSTNFSPSSSFSGILLTASEITFEANGSRNDSMIILS
jgi:hypothetical protein